MSSSALCLRDTPGTGMTAIIPGSGVQRRESLAGPHRRDGGFFFDTIHGARARTPAESIVAATAAAHEFHEKR